MISSSGFSAARAARRASRAATFNLDSSTSFWASANAAFSEEAIVAPYLQQAPR